MARILSSSHFDQLETIFWRNAYEAKLRLRLGKYCVNNGSFASHGSQNSSRIRSKLCLERPARNIGNSEIGRDFNNLLTAIPGPGARLWLAQWLCSEQKGAALRLAKHLLV